MSLEPTFPSFNYLEAPASLPAPHRLSKCNRRVSTTFGATGLALDEEVRVLLSFAQKLFSRPVTEPILVD